MSFVEYNLPKEAYASFDALTLKQFINDRLSTESIFTDQNFEGSNLAAIIDVVAFAYHILLFYQNQTASENMFNQATLYENMNKIVTSIGYKPTGPQTSLLPFTVNATSSLATGLYNIKRYSYFNINSTTYTFLADIAFEKTTTSYEELVAFSEGHLLFEGQIREYPLYTGIGEKFETITIAVDNIKSTAVESVIDHNSIDVYVKDSVNGTWSQYLETGSLYLTSPTEKAFEKRLNENGRYEIKFGDDISGKALKAGDEVAIYYLASTGEAGQVGAGALDNSLLQYFNTTQFRAIAADVFSDDSLTFLSINDTDKLVFTNTERSTLPTQFETVDEIRYNAPRLFSAQNRAVTTADYEVYVGKNFGNLIESTVTVNNTQYINEYIKYFYDIGLSKPNEDLRVLMNQVSFADSCDFNNIYVFMVPRIGAILNETDPNTLSTAQKQLVVNELEQVKMMSHEVVPSDPIFMAFDMGAVSDSVSTDVDIIRGETSLVISRNSNSKLSIDQIKNLVYTTILDFFDQTNNELGQLIDITSLNNSLLAINGVGDVYTQRVSPDGTIFNSPGIGFVTWNPIYPDEDMNITFQNIQLPFYKFPFLYEKTSFINKIKVIAPA